MTQERVAIRRQGPIPGIHTDKSRLAVAVDASRCTGQGVCVELAAAGFALDRFGYAYVLPGTTDRAAADPVLRGAIRDAESRCPQRAIRVTVVREPVRPPGDVPMGDPVGAAAATWVGDPVGAAAPASDATAAGPAASESRLLLVVADGPDQPESLDGWMARGGFGAPRGVPLIDEVARAGLVGHGGGGFPVAAKWRAARGVQPPVVVANGAEREPGSVKDRYLMARRPFLVLDGLRATAAAVGARQAFVGIDQDSADALARMSAAVDEATQRDLLDGVDVRVVAVPARFVAGEETALVRFVASGDPLPTSKPPYPAQSGYLGRPTVVHNVETLAQVALVAAHGAEWFRQAGTADAPGTGLFTVGRFDGGRFDGGLLDRPLSVVEHPYGTTLGQVLADAGWADATAALVGGWSGTVIPADRFDLPLTWRAVAAAGGVLGTKSVHAMVGGDCAVAVVASVLGHLADETSGQCPPCTRGVPYLADVVASLAAGTVSPDDLADASAFAATLVDRGACRLPDGAVRLLAGLLRDFPADVDRHLAGEPCAAGRGNG